MKLDIDKIIVVPNENFRKEFSGVNELAENIKLHGLLQPIVVDQDYKLIAGECRLRAVKKLGQTTIDVNIRQCENAKARIALSIFENTVRRTLLPGEELKALAWARENLQKSGDVAKAGGDRKSKCAGRTLIDDSFAKKLSRETGVSTRTIHEKARIGSLMSDGVADALNKREITQKQAEQLVKKPKDKQDQLVSKVRGKPLAATKVIVASVGATKKEIDEEKFIAEAKELFSTARKNLIGLTNIFQHIINRELVFLDIDSRMNLLMVEAEFETVWKKYKDLQYASRRRKRNQLEDDDDRTETRESLANARTIDID
jgi:ParB family chromosome partitioning protein